VTTSGNIATVPMGFLIGAPPPWPYNGGNPQDVPLSMIRRKRRNRVRVIGEAVTVVPAAWAVLSM
jgi:hypothetical protein